MHCCVSDCPWAKRGAHSDENREKLLEGCRLETSVLLEHPSDTSDSPNRNDLTKLCVISKQQKQNDAFKRRLQPKMRPEYFWCVLMWVGSHQKMLSRFTKSEINLQTRQRIPKHDIAIAENHCWNPGLLQLRYWENTATLEEGTAEKDPEPENLSHKRNSAIGKCTHNFKKWLASNLQVKIYL